MKDLIKDIYLFVRSINNLLVEISVRLMNIEEAVAPRKNATISEDIQHVGYDAEQCGREK